MISRENYELYFIDYADGNLSSEEIQNLHAFLLLHPDLLKEFEEFEPFIIHKKSPVDSSILDFTKLKKVNPIHESNIHEYLIAKLEGDITQEEERYIEDALTHNNSYKTLWLRYQKTKFLSNNIIYPNKEKLKKYWIKLYWNTAIAASFIGILGLLSVYLYMSHMNVVRSYAERTNSIQLPLDIESKDMISLTPTLIKKQEGLPKSKKTQVKKINSQPHVSDFNSPISEESENLAYIPIISPKIVTERKNTILNKPEKMTIQEFPLNINETNLSLADFVQLKLQKQWKKLMVPKNDKTQNDWLAFIQNITNNNVSVEKTSLNKDNSIAFQVQFGDKLTITKKRNNP